MACSQRDHLCARPIGHEELEIGIDRAIRGGDCIVARFHRPSGIGRLRLCDGLRERFLYRIEDAGAGQGNVGREIVQEGLLSEPPFVAVEHDPGGRGWGGKAPSQRSVVFDGVRRPGGDRDECRTFGAPPTSLMIVPAKKWPTSKVGPVEGGQRVLDRDNVQPRCLQSADDVGPSRPVREQPVHEHDVAGWNLGGALRFGRRRQRGSCGCGDRSCNH